MNDFLGEVDVLHGEPERLPLPKSQPRTDLDEELVAVRHRRPYLARPFLNWLLLRRARQRAAIRRHPASANRDLRRRVSVALDFLAWLDQRGLALADLAQEHIDDWIAGSPAMHDAILEATERFGKNGR